MMMIAPFRKSISRSINRRSFLTVCLCLASMLGAHNAFGQGSTPQRGFQPAGSYAFGDFETINTKNGNMLLTFPLGKLPAGRGGLSAGINLVYNSKLYDSYHQYDQYCDTSGCVPVEKDVLRPSTEGGWQYVIGYEVQVTDRMDQFLSYPDRPQCPDDYSTRVYQVKIKFPDGSVHTLKADWLQQSNYSPDGQYTDIRFDGVQKYCQVYSTWPTYQYTEEYHPAPSGVAGRSYYTTDGTYARLEVNYDGDLNPVNNSWTLYLSDGTRVTNAAGIERIYDRNNNYVEVRSVTANGHPATQVADQLGRSVTLEYGASAAEDTITSQGFGQALTCRIPWKNIRLNKTYRSAWTPLYDGIYELSVVDKIILPSQSGGLEYKFGYNAPDSSSGSTAPSNGWGEVSSVTLPTGAKASYQYTKDGVNTSIDASEVLDNRPSRKDVVYRSEYDLTTAVSNTPCNTATETCATETWLYGVASDGIGFSITAPDGGVSSDSDGSYSNQRDRSISADGTKVERIRAYNPPPGTLQPQSAQINSYVKQEFTSITNAAGSYVKTVIKEYDQDKNGNVTRVKEYDWVPYGDVARSSFDQPTGAIPASAVLKRVTVNDYWVVSPDASDNTSQSGYTYSQGFGGGYPTTLHNVKSTEVRSGLSDTQAAARTEFYYDDPEFKGNLVTKKSWDSMKGSLSRPLNDSYCVITGQQYDAYGNPTLSTDAKGNQALLVYGSVGSNTGLYPTQAKSAYGTAIEKVTSTEYDFSTGLVTRVTDPNGVAAWTDYDVFGRPTLVKSAEGLSVEARTQIAYSDSSRRVVTRKDLSAVGDGKLVGVVHYDQLGRVRLTRQLEDAAMQSETDETQGVKVQTRYAYGGSNSYQLISSPYRAPYSYQAANELTMGWSRSKSDNGGRVVEVQTFGGNSMPAPWGANASGSGAITTTYDAEFTTVTDQSGKVRRSMMSALGQLVRVDEPDGSGSLGSSSSPAQPTSYAYDALGNLTQVSQGGQTRAFNYSSLARLTSATNPESGTVSYSYDNNGNLYTKTDASNITITYAYDALNRNTTVDYSNTTVNPDIERYYDNPAAGAYGKGRFWYSYAGGNYAAGSDVEHAAVDSYDAMGRPLVRRQLFKTAGAWGATYQTSRIYNRMGLINSQTYPSGHTVSYTTDATGRLSSFSGNLGDGAQRTYSSNVSYDAASRLQQEQFGTQVPLYHKMHYNVRGQLYDIRLSTQSEQTSPWDWNRGALLNYYSQAELGAGTNEARSLSGAENNGNVKRSSVYVPTDPNGTYNGATAGSYFTAQQSYSYDSLDRLTRMDESTGLTQGYTYDRFGNRQIDAAQTTAGLNNKQFTIDAATNRLTHAGMAYDNAGNLTQDTYSALASQRSYDAENRMTMEQSSATSVFSRYAYDADGHRTRRDVGGSVTWQVYGFGGELLAEYAGGAAPASPQKEYGYRAGELLVTAEPGGMSQGAQSVAWQNAVGVTASPGSLTKTAGSAWNTGGASSAQSIQSGDGYVEFTAALSTDDVLCGLSHGDTNQDYSDIDFAIYASYYNNTVFVLEGGVNKGAFGAFSAGDKFRVAVDGGVVKYYRVTNGTPTLFYTSAGAPSYPLLADTSLFWTGDRITDVVMSAGGGGSWQLPGFVTSFYTSILSRQPTGAELSAQVSTLTTAVSQGQAAFFNAASQMGQTLFLSQEYANRQRSDHWFIYDLYVAFLSREPDSGGWAAWEAGVPSQGRPANIYGFSSSGNGEWVNRANAQYNSVVAAQAQGGGGGINWLVSDHLGTPRMVVDQTGSLSGIKRHDYLPFGEELFAGTGGRTQTQGYNVNVDGNRKRWAKLERDDETGLDYAQARYYSSAIGRFTSPDEFTGGPDDLFDFADAAASNPTFYADLTNPQSLNKYQYCYNNPLRYLDPNGHQQEESYWESFKRYIQSLGRQVERGMKPQSEPPSEERAPGQIVPMNMTEERFVSVTSQKIGQSMEKYYDVLEVLDVTGGSVKTLRSYAKGDKAGMAMGVGGMIIGAAGEGFSLTFREAKSLVGKWGTGTFETTAKSIRYHFGEHGAEVGAKNVWQYLRKAEGFARNLKGARTSQLENGATRYMKNGYYVIKDKAGKILSYGRAR